MPMLACLMGSPIWVPYDIVLGLYLGLHGTLPSLELHVSLHGTLVNWNSVWVPTVLC